MRVSELKQLSFSKVRLLALRCRGRALLLIAMLWSRAPRQVREICQRVWSVRNASPRFHDYQVLGPHVFPEVQPASPGRGANAGAPVSRVGVLAVRARLNGRNRWIPMEVADPAKGTAVYRAAQIVRRAGGFEASLRTTPMTAAEIWLSGCPHPERAKRRLDAIADDILQVGMDGVSGQCIPVGCIPALDVRDHGAGDLGVMLYAESVDALTGGVIETAAHAIALWIARLAECSSKPSIQLGVTESQRVRVRCHIELGGVGNGPAEVRHGDVLEIDKVIRNLDINIHRPELAAKHNAFVLEGLSAAAAALGIEAWRVRVAAQAHAARWGSCEPLATWRRVAGKLLGELEIPVDVASVYVALPFRADREDERGRHQATSDVIVQVAALGLAASLAYLRSALLEVSAHEPYRPSQPPPLPVELEPRGLASSRKAAFESGIHFTVRADIEAQAKAPGPLAS